MSAAAYSAPLPRPGPIWGSHPERRPEAPTRRAPPIAWPGHYQRIVERARVLAAQALDGAPRCELPLDALRGRLRREGFTPATQALVLARLISTCEQALGRSPYDCQLFAAAVLLDNGLAEMATGEGKTLATALAAAAAGIGGTPVHIVTANDYLAQRDAQAMQPLFEALGLSVGCVLPTLERDARRRVYACDIVYCTAKELAFDALRDRLAVGAFTDEMHRRASALSACGAGTRPVLRGLCMAILDEADSILLDEASMPLILSRAAPHSGRRAFLWQALALARQLQADKHFSVEPNTRHVRLNPDGQALVVQLSEALGGPWQRGRYRDEAVSSALTALHVQQRERDYLVRDGRVEILDAVTGRRASGRVWSRGLHTLVELKEQCTPTPDTETVAQTSFQRFFQRYVRLCGTSGTLHEARAELRRVYGLSVVRVPLRTPSRRVELPLRSFAESNRRWDAVAARVAEMRRLNRPVLIGTDSVADSSALSLRLAQAGIEHAVLDARHDADEAALVAAAGRASQVTVATRMAGRGTDIDLDDAARSAGGLHVIVCQRNPARRMDRQLRGRAGRQGDPGSTETLLLTVHADSNWPISLAAVINLGHRLVQPALRWLIAAPQRTEERRLCAMRRHLLEQDLEWERRLSFAAPAG